MKALMGNWVYLCIYLQRPSKMPWNLPPWGSSWNSRWLRCMMSGLLWPPPGAWSWWHQQGSPAMLPVHLVRQFITYIMKLFQYVQMVSHSDIPAVASRRAWNGYSIVVRCDKSTVYTARDLEVNVGRKPKYGASQLSRCLLPAMAPAVSSCSAPSLPSSSVNFSLVCA